MEYGMTTRDSSNIITKRHVVELIGREDDEPAIITPYVEVNITGGVTGVGRVNNQGQVNVKDTKLSAAVKVDGIVQGEGSIENNTINISTHIEDWLIQPAEDNKVLNIFRRRL